VNGNHRVVRRVCAVGGFYTLFVAGVMLFTTATDESRAGSLLDCWRGRQSCSSTCDGPPLEEVGGTWYWLRSPDEEKRVVAGLYNRYCIRCHGVDGRGVWDIPDVPNFTNVRWQASRSDGQLARNILEGRGAVMPPFRGTLSLEECWAMARYLRTFVPGTEASRPDFGRSEKNGAGLASPPGAPAKP
jgi:hypothetical protein